MNVLFEQSKKKCINNFTTENTFRYIPILQDLVRSYNHSVRSTTKIASAKVKDSNVNEIWERFYGRKKSTTLKCKFQRDDYVRVSKYKNKLEKVIYLIRR